MSLNPRDGRFSRSQLTAQLEIVGFLEHAPEKRPLRQPHLLKLVTGYKSRRQLAFALQNAGINLGDKLLCIGLLVSVCGEKFFGERGMRVRKRPNEFPSILFLGP